MAESRGCPGSTGPACNGGLNSGCGGDLPRLPGPRGLGWRRRGASADGADKIPGGTSNSRAACAVNTSREHAELGACLALRRHSEHRTSEDRQPPSRRRDSSRVLERVREDVARSLMRQTLRGAHRHCLGRGNCFYGQRRTDSMTGTYRF